MIGLIGILEIADISDHACMKVFKGLQICDHNALDVVSMLGWTFLSCGMCLVT